MRYRQQPLRHETRDLWPLPARIVAIVLAILAAVLWPVVAFR